MLSTVHTLISIPFGVHLLHPAGILIGTFVFHLFADSLLHWNVYPESFSKKVFYSLAFLDVGGGVLLAWLITGNAFFTLPILLAILGGNLPDILQGLWDLLPQEARKKLSILQPAFHFHDRIQLETTSVSKGLVWQALLVALAIAVI